MAFLHRRLGDHKGSKVKYPEQVVDAALFLLQVQALVALQRRQLQARQLCLRGGKEAGQNGI